MTNKDSTATATKADITELRNVVEGGFKRVEQKLSTHDREFEVVTEMLSELQKGSEQVQRDVRAIADKLRDDFDRRLLACERRLGLAV